MPVVAYPAPWHVAQAAFAGCVPPGGDPWQVVHVSVPTAVHVRLALFPFRNAPWQYTFEQVPVDVGVVDPVVDSA
jgi:hypothetical protein